MSPRPSQAVSDPLLWVSRQLRTPEIRSLFMIAFVDPCAACMADCSDDIDGCAATLTASLEFATNTDDTPLLHGKTAKQTPTRARHQGKGKVMFFFAVCRICCVPVAWLPTGHGFPQAVGGVAPHWPGNSGCLAATGDHPGGPAEINGKGRRTDISLVQAC